MVDGFLRKMKDAIVGDDEQVEQEGGYDEQYGDVRPASEDPYGDPAYQQYGDVLPASQDPYGDPADQENY